MSDNAVTHTPFSTQMTSRVSFGKDGVYKVQKSKKRKPFPELHTTESKVNKQDSAVIHVDADKIAFLERLNQSLTSSTDDQGHAMIAESALEVIQGHQIAYSTHESAFTIVIKLMPYFSTQQLLDYFCALAKSPLTVFTSLNATSVFQICVEKIIRKAKSENSVPMHDSSFADAVARFCRFVANQCDVIIKELYSCNMAVALLSAMTCHDFSCDFAHKSSANQEKKLGESSELKIASPVLKLLDNFVDGIANCEGFMEALCTNLSTSRVVESLLFLTSKAAKKKVYDRLVFVVFKDFESEHVLGLCQRAPFCVQKLIWTCDENMFGRMCEILKPNWLDMPEHGPQFHIVKGLLLNAPNQELFESIAFSIFEKVDVIAEGMAMLFAAIAEGCVRYPACQYKAWEELLRCFKCTDKDCFKLFSFFIDRENFENNPTSAGFKAPASYFVQNLLRWKHKRCLLTSLLTKEPEFIKRLCCDVFMSHFMQMFFAEESVRSELKKKLYFKIKPNLREIYKEAAGTFVVGSIFDNSPLKRRIAIAELVLQDGSGIADDDELTHLKKLRRKLKLEAFESDRAHWELTQKRRIAQAAKAEPECTAKSGDKDCAVPAIVEATVDKPAKKKWHKKKFRASVSTTDKDGKKASLVEKISKKVKIVKGSKKQY